MARPLFNSFSGREDGKVDYVVVAFFVSYVIAAGLVCTCSFLSSIHLCRDGAVVAAPTPTPTPTPTPYFQLSTPYSLLPTLAPAPIPTPFILLVLQLLLELL